MAQIDPVRELLGMQAQMSRLFDDHFGGLGLASEAAGRTWAPAIDVREMNDELVVTAELPGMAEKDIHLSIVDNILSLRGERKAPEASEGSYHRVERWSGTFERHVQLPVPVQPERVKASYGAGVLEVRLPKVEEIKPREIKIEVQ